MVKNKKTKKKISAIVQARMTSTRLPGKVLMDIEGKPMLWHILNRLSFSKILDDIILAIPDTKPNNILEKFAKDNGVKYFRGNEEDVLFRYYKAAKKFKCDIIARISADNPLIDPQIIDLVVKKHLISSADYTSNDLKKTFPLGLDVEVFNFKVLEKAQKEAKENYQREHVTPYIYEHPEIFRIAVIENTKNLSHLRWTVDEKADLDLVKEIYKRLYKKEKVFLMDDIVVLLKQYPKLMNINKDVKQKAIWQTQK